MLAVRRFRLFDILIFSGDNGAIDLGCPVQMVCVCGTCAQYQDFILVIAYRGAIGLRMDAPVVKCRFFLLYFYLAGIIARQLGCRIRVAARAVKVTTCSRTANISSAQRASIWSTPGLAARRADSAFRHPHRKQIKLHKTHSIFPRRRLAAYSGRNSPSLEEEKRIARRQTT